MTTTPSKPQLSGYLRTHRQLLLTLLMCVSVGAVLTTCAWRVREFYSGEFDEGVYLTTFQSIRRGFAAYRQTYLSQPPGFLVTTYPLYRLYGATLEGARMAVFTHSLLGLLALLWLGKRMGQPWFACLATSLMYLCPIYTTEIVTFHADSLPATYSTLALAATLQASVSRRPWLWLAAAGSCVTTAFMIKGDVSSVPAVAALVLRATWVARRDPRALLRWLGVLALSGTVAGLLFLLPFGVGAIYENVVRLRQHAAASGSSDYTRFIEFLKFNNELRYLSLAGAALMCLTILFRARARWHALALLLWLLTTLGMLLVYRPLQGHHMVFLTVPAAASVAFALCTWLDALKLRAYVHYAALVAIVVTLDRRLLATSTTKPGITSKQQRRGIELVRARTQPDDFIVCDDGLISGLTGRPVPPYLTDLSFVRITSGSLPEERFEAALRQYKPKLVLVWADRLHKLKDFDRIMKRYDYRLITKKKAQQRAYQRKS